MKHAAFDATVRHYDDLIPANERGAFATRLQATRHAIAVGDQLRDARALTGMTIREVAALARASTSAASRLERGDPDVSIDRLRPRRIGARTSLVDRLQVKPQLVNGWAVAGICLIRLGQLRPSGVPARLGLTSECRSCFVSSGTTSTDCVQACTSPHVTARPS